MNRLKALKAGMTGAAALNLVHETGRHWIPNAPHVDLLAMRALGLYFLMSLGLHPNLKNLRRWTMAGDLISNSLYYALMLVASKHQNSRSIWKRAWLYGAGAGALVVVLPSLMKKLGQQPSKNLPLTASLTVAWYTLGSLVAASLYTRMKNHAQPA